MTRKKISPLPSDSILLELFSTLGSIYEIQQRLGIEISRKRIKRRLGVLGVDLSHYPDGTEILRASGAKKGRESFAATTKERFEVEIAPILFRKNSPIKPHLVRRYFSRWNKVFNWVEEKCESCLMGPEWQGKKLVLQIDHRNGDSLDNRLENLRLLCPNCHSQSETFCGGKLKGRKKSQETTLLKRQNRVLQYSLEF